MTGATLATRRRLWIVDPFGTFGPTFQGWQPPCGTGEAGWSCRGRPT